LKNSAKYSLGTSPILYAGIKAIPFVDVEVESSKITPEAENDQPDFPS
jgi:hypothetical protein